MNKKFLSLSFIITIMCSFIFMCGVVKADELQVDGMYGIDRYDTNCKIADKGWKNSDCAVIVGGEFIRNDNLCAAVLAKKFNAPILLSNESSIGTNTENELKKLKVKKVFIIGGTGAVGTSVENRLHYIGIKTQRINGMDMVGNSIEIANEVGTNNGIILVDNAAANDIATLAPIAAKMQMPILLGGIEYASTEIEKFISNRNIPVIYIVGEKGSFNDPALNKLGNVKRINISDATSQMDILNAFSDKINFDNVFYVYERNFSDLISCSALAALNGNPIVIEYPKDPGLERNLDYLNIIGSKNVKKVNVIGLNDDTPAISSESKAFNILKSRLKNNQNYGISNIKVIEVNQGINYYAIELYNKSNQSLKYNFLVNINTKDAYIIQQKTNKIILLDNNSKIDL